MAVKVQDFSDFEEQNTLEFRVPVYKLGIAQGQVATWRVPPVNLETEMAVRATQAAQMKELTQALQAKDEDSQKIDVENDVRCLGDYWAPMVALYVKTPQFDAEELKRDYPGGLLRLIGQAAQNFFLFGTLPEVTPQESPQKTP